jgi:hypothetical protein
VPDLGSVVDGKLGDDDILVAFEATDPIGKEVAQTKVAWHQRWLFEWQHL